MSLNVTKPTGKLRQKARIEYIEKHILFETQEEMSEFCGVNRRTIARDIDKWKQKGGYNRFLIKEFFELYGKEKIENPSRALDRILYLMTKDKNADTSPITSIKVKIIERQPNTV